MVTRPDILQVLEPGYDALFDQAVEVFAADERVRAVWLSGSLGRGDADAMSDLDLIVAVADEALPDFAAQWPDWLAHITPTLIARSLPFAPGSLYAVTPERLRIDVVAEPASRVGKSPFRHRVVVFDRDGPAKCPCRVDRPSARVDANRGVLPRRGHVSRRTGHQDWLLNLEAIHLVRHCCTSCSSR